MHKALSKDRPITGFSNPKLRFFAILVGNVFDHYDQVLYTLLAPFIAKKFFPQLEATTILAIAYFPFCLLLRPIGSLFFGFLGDLKGRKVALFYSLIGLSCTTALMGLLPTYAQIGVCAPVLLALLRGFTGFFAVGEQTGAPLLLLENIPSKKKEFWSSLYEVSGMIGALLASLVTLLLILTKSVELLWRFAFLAGAIFTLFGVLMRTESEEWFLELPKKKLGFSTLKKEWKSFLAMVCVTGFSCANYRVAMVLVTVLLLHMGVGTPALTLSIHTLLICFDILLLPFFGWVATHIGKERLMLGALLFLMALIFPLFNLVANGSAHAIFLLRLALVFFGVAVAAPYQLWMHDAAPAHCRYTLISTSKSVSKQLFEGPIIPLTLLLKEGVGFSLLLPWYLFGCTFLAALSIWIKKKNSLTISK